MEITLSSLSTELQMDLNMASGTSQIANIPSSNFLLLIFTWKAPIFNFPRTSTNTVNASASGRSGS